jgi:hypothetical protein
MRVLAAILVLAGVAAGAVPAAAKPDFKPARALFERYVTLEAKFDPAVADLYADDALIRNTRRYPDGQVKTIELPAPQYKALVVTAMPLAKAKNDRSRYTKVTYAAEGANVRIRARRYSLLKKYTSPVSLLVGPGEDGTWVVREEISESQP